MNRGIAWVAILGLCSFAQADIVSLTNATQTSVPSSFVEGTLESNSTVHVVSERRFQSGVSVTADVAGIAGLSISAGTEWHSYIFHYDPVGDPTILTPASIAGGSATFASPILGIQALGATLTLNEILTGASGVTYPSLDALRGVEEVPLLSNFFTVSPDFRTVSWGSMSIPSIAADRIDQFRVFTAVPEPNLALLIAPVAAAGLFYRWRRRTLVAA